MMVAVLLASSCFLSSCSEMRAWCGLGGGGGAGGGGAGDACCREAETGLKMRKPRGGGGGAGGGERAPAPAAAAAAAPPAALSGDAGLGLRSGEGPSAGNFDPGGGGGAGAGAGTEDALEGSLDRRWEEGAWDAGSDPCRDDACDDSAWASEGAASSGVDSRDTCCCDLALRTRSRACCWSVKVDTAALLPDCREPGRDTVLKPPLLRRRCCSLLMLASESLGFGLGISRRRLGCAGDRCCKRLKRLNACSTTASAPPMRAPERSLLLACLPSNLPRAAASSLLHPAVTDGSLSIRG
jgi:hypothetical protein